MGDEYLSRTFQSGNSVALRLPAALGIKPGREWRVISTNGQLIIEEVKPDPVKIDLTGIAGSISWLNPLSARDRDMEDRDLDWRGSEA